MVERLKVLRLALQIATAVVGILMPSMDSGTKVTAVFVVLTGAAGLGGWLLGRGEAQPGRVTPTATRLLVYSLAFFVAYMVLTAGLPRVGIGLPILYEDELFLPLVVVRAILWALAIGTIVRLLALLDRVAGRKVSRARE